MRASSPDVKTLLVKAGDKVELDCSAVGHPNTEIFWYKYNIPLLDITYHKLEDTLESRKLVLDNVLLADAGNYSCHMNNTLGSMSRTFILHVYESSNNQPMILKALLANTTATLGSEASFHCHVTSDSVTYFRWYFKRVVNVSSNSTSKDLNEITSVLPFKVSSFADNGLNSHLFRGEAVFVIQNVSFKDEGEYICEALNEHGKVRHGAFLMVVKGPTHSAREVEARYAARFGKTLQLPLAMLIAVPVAFMILMTAVFIRALEKAK